MVTKKCQTCQNINSSIDAACKKCTLKTLAYNRYSQSNIPVDYWDLSMDKFTGEEILLNKYNYIIDNIESFYDLGSSLCFEGPHGTGKQICLDTEIPTPNGFVKLIDIKEGDELFDEKGNVCKVIKLHPINISPECYKIKFDDGSEVDACAEHLWHVYSLKDRVNNDVGNVLTTKQLLNELKINNKTNFSILNTKPVNYIEKTLPIDPYVLGNALAKNCYDNNLNKPIPDIYMLGSYEQRLKLVQGILDISGKYNKKGEITFSTTSIKLANDFCELIQSLGIKTKVNKKYNIKFVTDLPVFKSKVNYNLNKDKLYKNKHRYIVDIQSISSKPMRCLTVDSESHLFLITRSFIPTHNTMTSCNILKKFVQKGYSGLYTTLTDCVNILTISPNEEKYNARKLLLSVDLLVIDEFDSRFIASDTAGDLFGRTLENIFRTRTQNKMPTILCTNSPNIIDTFSGAIKKSLESLLTGYVERISIFGKDYRKILNVKP